MWAKAADINSASTDAAKQKHSSWEQPLGLTSALAFWTECWKADHLATVYSNVTEEPAWMKERQRQKVVA